MTTRFLKNKATPWPSRSPRCGRARGTGRAPLRQAAEWGRPTENNTRTEVGSPILLSLPWMAHPRRPSAAPGISCCAETDLRITLRHRRGSDDQGYPRCVRLGCERRRQSHGGAQHGSVQLRAQCIRECLQINSGIDK